MRRALLLLLPVAFAFAAAGCAFGRPYGPHEYDALRCADARCSPGSLARSPRDRDGSLPPETCRALCVGKSVGELRACWAVTSAIVPKPLPRRVAWVFKRRVQPPDGYYPDAPSWAALPDDVSVAGTDPEHLDAGVCLRAFERKFKEEAPPKDLLEQNVVAGCHLIPAPPGPGSELVQCHFYVPGGTDLIPR